jgi:hypothetical protein
MAGTPRYVGPAIIHDNGDVAFRDPNSGGLRWAYPGDHSVQQDAQGGYHVWAHPHVTLIPVDYDPFA